MASEDEVAQVAQAIAIASDPSQSTLHPEALQFISSIQSNASTTWRLGLALFAGSAADGTRKYPPQARFFGLRILDEFLDNRFEPLEEQTFQVLQQGLISYIQSEYQYGPAEAGATFLRNRFSRTLTLFFLCTYLDRWQSFFDDIFTLIRPPTTQEVPQFNPHVSLLLFHLILEISGEVADQMLKAARPFDNRRHARDGRVRDAVRDRDASAINEAVLTIVADSVEKMSEVRKGDTSLPANTLIEVIDWGVRAFGSYVGWIDINLTVTPSTIPLLFGLLSDPSLPIRLATAAAFVKLVGKGLKQPGDKLQLIKVLALGQVIDTLEQKTKEEQTNRGDDTDDGEESYREALSRLLNILGLELSKLMEDNDASHDVRIQANVHREQLMPTMLRFLGDAYDDTSCTVFPLLSTVLLNYKKLKQSSGQLTGVQQAFLSNTLNVLLEKLKWEEEDDPDEMDEDERHVFESLRGGELRVHIDSIFSIDPELTSSMIHRRVMTSLTAYESGSNNLKWNEAELSIYLIYIYGDINKSGGKGRVAFCHAPSVPKDFRKERDYSQFPLTHHGEMLFELVRSGIVSYPHPFVSMQFFETCARYGDFFKVRKECIIPLLEAMVDSRGLHHPTSGFRTRVYYLFYKFVREDKNEISGDLAVTLLNGVGDLFEIEVELPEPSSAEHLDLLTASIENPRMFDSQLNLFEAAGILISITYKNPEQARALLLSVVTPLLNSLSRCLQVTIRGPEDVFSIVKVHHIIMALGNVAKGFPDIPFPIPPNHILPPVDVFREISQAILVSLEAMNAFKVVRDATRFAFTRIVATAGSSVTDLIPILMTSLLAHFERSELVDFMHFIGLLMHRLQHELFDVLDQLIGPLGERVTELLSQPTTGTDDKLAYADTKKGYMNLLNNIMVNQLHGVLISDKNKTRFESLMQNMEQVAQDCNDPACARIAISFLTRCINVWGSNQAIPVNGNGHPNISSEPLPGFERFIYEHLVPLVFALPLQPSFNIKDGQMIVMLHELASLLQSVMKARGQEAYDFLVSVFLPAQNCPPDAAVDFANNIRDLDSKSFRKFFAEFIRLSRPTGS